MWFKNLLVYRLNKWDITPALLEEKLSNNAIQACSAMEMQRLGWISPKEEGQPFVHMLGAQMLICLDVEKKLLPTTVINKFAKSRAAVIEEQQGYKPGRKQMKQIKEAVTDELLPRAFTLRRHTFAWIDPIAGILAVDASNLGKADELIEILIKTVDGIAFTPLRTNISPATAMTSWLGGNDLPSIFTVDRDCELRGSGEERATVRYVRHTLEAEEIARHITAGKEVSRLAMTWNDKVSFVLHDNLQLKRIGALDILKDQAEGSGHDDVFDTDFAIMTGELRKMLADVVKVLGGENTPAS